MGAHLDAACKSRKLGHAAVETEIAGHYRRLDCPANSRYGNQPGIRQGGLARRASLARPESVTLRRLWDREKDHVSSIWAPRWAGGAAIDARRADGIDEFSVRLAITLLNRLPKQSVAIATRN